ncbi:MAG: asparaginase [Synechococcaceae cyanobacterium SM2_3_2]|nr:asparaginase [Synechococcaceae cyanobacterium SM2_3_2]
MKPKVAVIGTGGTIASLGLGPFDIQDYGAQRNMMQIDGMLAHFPEVYECADIVPVPYKAIASIDIGFADWKKLVNLTSQMTIEDPDLVGFVITHGTSSIEETAWFLSLTAKTPLPIVVVGSQRPASALSTDAGMNLANAIRTAACPDSCGLGGLVMLNDEIQAAREVTKTSTFRLQTFRTPDFGILGHADGDRIIYYRQPLRRTYPNTEFDISALDALPRVDIVYAYTGCDGTATRAFVAAGAQGIVSAGFAPGWSSSAEAEALMEAARSGVVVMQSTRSGSGRVVAGQRHREGGILTADNLNPQKARILLSLALTVTQDPQEIERIFLTY